MSVLRLGTRQSPLALVQAKRVMQCIQTQFPNTAVQIVPIQTQGDIDKTSPLSELGGKGVFVTALQEALLKEEIDVAVHSLKDMTSLSPCGLAFMAFLRPESIKDVLVLATPGTGFSDLKRGATLATGSMRREALITHLRPDVTVVPIRGNIHTRLRTVEEQGYDGVITSESALIRLNISPAYAVSLDPQTFIPAPGQGVIVVEGREKDRDIREICDAISDPHQAVLSSLEWVFLREIGLDCGYPLGMYSRLTPSHFQTQLMLKDLERDKTYLEEHAFTRENAQQGLQELARKFKGMLTTSEQA